MKSCPIRPLQLVAGLILFGLLILALPIHVARAEGEAQSGACSGSYYTVKRGDTWSVISRREGISIADLKRANPQAVRARDLLYAGETICIPSASGAATPAATAASAQGATQSGGYWYQVRAGDTWNKISRATGVPVRELWAANPGLLNRRQWLYIGQRVWIPDLTAGAATPTASATPVATAAVVVTVETVMTATAQIPATATPVPTATAAPSVTPLATVASTATPVPTAVAAATTATPTALPPKPSDCPKTLADYDASIARFLNTAGNDVEKLNRSLLLCRVAQGETPGAVSANITGANSADASSAVVVAINDAAEEGPVTGALLVYHRAATGYALAHKAAGQGQIALIDAADINEDGKLDLVYSDTSCGAHTCFGELHVDSWDGKAYADWIEGDPTIAGPEYSVKDVSKDGQGAEIIVHGGVIGSVGAGPQRAWTETYISPAGGAYRLLSQVYDASDCLYHQIIDANRAFDAWALGGFDPAIEAYQAALAAKAPQACGTIKDEVKTLQDFARFRLVVADVAGGSAADAAKVAAGITHAGLKKAVATFMGSYTANSSVIQACRDVTELAETDSTTWQFLADWGYANPSFTAQELCPLN